MEPIQIGLVVTGLLFVVVLLGMRVAFAAGLAGLKAKHPIVHETRQCGFVSGIELRQPDGNPFPAHLRTGEVLCLAARAHGLLTRPILDTIVLMPPLCCGPAEIDHALAALDSAFSAHPGIDTRPPTT